MRKGIRIVKFTVETGENTGEMGLVPLEFKNWTNYNPSFGTGFGHDLIEHGKKETGAFDEELAAHGAILFTTNFLNFEPYGNKSPEMLASGMSYQYKESTVEGIRNPPKHRGVTWEERREVKAFALGYTVAMIKEWEREKDYCYECDQDCQCPNPFEGRETFKKILGWMLYGYARAKRIYNDNNWLAYALKKEIEKVTAQEMPWLQDFADSGQVFTMRLDLYNASVEIQSLRW